MEGSLIYLDMTFFDDLTMELNIGSKTETWVPLWFWHQGEQPRKATNLNRSHSQLSIKSPGLTELYGLWFSVKETELIQGK